MLWTLFCLLTPIVSFVLEDKHDEVRLFPNKEIGLTPFTVRAETDRENELDFELQFICSKATNQALTFGSPDSDICTKESYTGTIAEINTYLQNIKVSVTSSSSAKGNTYIRYSINYKDGDHKDTRKKFEQHLKITTKIPTDVINDEIFYKHNSETSFSLKVVEINPAYSENVDNDQLSIVMKENTLPSWVKYSFKNNALYLEGETPSDLDNDINFTFMIQDKLTDLKSDEITVGIVNSEEINNTSSRILVLSLFIILSLGMLSAILLVFIRGNKEDKKPTMIASVENQQMNAQNDQKDANNDVLSDSILQWNKKLINKHKEKSENDLSFNSEKHSKTPEFGYEQFDQSFGSGDDNVSPDFKISDRLSDIQPTEKENQETEGNKSAFFEDEHFNNN